MMNPPVILTENAIQHIKSMLEKTPHGLGFRLSIKKTGCSGFAYVPEIIEKINEQDIHFVAQDDLHIYVDVKSLELLENITVDYVSEDIQGLKQKRLVFINPKEAGRCGCGESFTI
jgi:iron-sulfur cluster assembly protein